MRATHMLRRERASWRHPFRVNPEGTVYPALHRLEEDGLVRSCWAEQPVRRLRGQRLSAGVVALAMAAGYGTTLYRRVMA